MSHLSLILLLGVGLFVVRVSGFYLGRLAVSPQQARFLHYTPFGALTALIVAGVVRQPANLLAQLVAIVITIATLRFSHQMWAGILAGMTSFWLLNQLLT